MWIARTGVDASLTQLSIAGFDSESQSILFANGGGSAMHSPSCEQQLFLRALAVLFPVRTVRDAHRKRHAFALSILERVLVPTGLLLPDGVQSGGAFVLAAATTEHDRHQKVQLLLLQIRNDGRVEEAPVEQQTPDLQADFANSVDQSPQRDFRAFVPPDPSQSHCVTLAIFDDAGCGISVK